MSKSNFEKAVALGGAVTAVFGVLSSLNPHLAYSRVDFIIDTLRTSFVLEFQPLPFTIGLLLSGFGGYWVWWQPLSGEEPPVWFCAWEVFWGVWGFSYSYSNFTPAYGG